MLQNDKHLIGDIMTKNVVTAYEDTPILEASEQITPNRFNGLPVIDKDRKVIGIITEHNILAKGAAVYMPKFIEFFSKSHNASNEPPPIDLSAIFALTVKNIMNHAPIIASVDESIEELIKIFSQHHIVNPIPIVDKEGILVGIVSRFDIVKYYADVIHQMQKAH